MIVFRVDANEQVATGHLMRTLSIASACRKRGLTCEFWLAEEKEKYYAAILAREDSSMKRGTSV